MGNSGVLTLDREDCCCSNDIDRQFCLELGPAVKLVQILPYHRLGAVKYERLQKKYALATLEPPSNEHMDNCKKLIESYGLKVQIH
jgi:pyruvate formate lyase activating enzyme